MWLDAPIYTDDAMTTTAQDDGKLSELNIFQFQTKQTEHARLEIM